MLKGKSRVQDSSIINNWMLSCPMIVNRQKGAMILEVKEVKGSIKKIVMKLQNHQISQWTGGRMPELVTLSTDLHSDWQCLGSLEILANLYSSPFEPRNSDISSGMDDESNNCEMVNSGLEIPNAALEVFSAAIAFRKLAEIFDQLKQRCLKRNQNVTEKGSSPETLSALSIFMFRCDVKEYRQQSGDDDNGSTFSNVVNPNDFLSFSEPELEEILEDISWSAPIWFGL
ncbi:hypothetical protein CK203_076084 [Vitis vinifera]|uniref:Uncharacterized protein n=1 Tax=Vitis vinifera TaxID=29760 RepID=A0A438EM11_VITVI|nr:hypothetical protein CK203_076084 [Vitis vinifera]